MRLVTVILLLLLCLGTLPAGVYGLDREIGRLSYPEKESSEDVLVRAFREEYSESWLDSYVDEKSRKEFSMQYSKMLLSLLPLDDLLFSQSDKEYFLLKSREKRTIVTVFHDDGKITAIGITSY